MLKKTITFTNLNGEDVTEDLYFHLNKAETTMLLAELGGDLEQYTQDLANSGDLKAMLEFLQDIILRSYGKRSIDGNSFIKNQELRTKFENSVSYAELFEQLLTNEDEMYEFSQGLITLPNQQSKVQEGQIKTNNVNFQGTKNTVPFKQKEQPSQKKDMSPEQVLQMVQNNPELLEQLQNEVNKDE